MLRKGQIFHQGTSKCMLMLRLGPFGMRADIIHTLEREAKVGAYPSWYLTTAANTVLALLILPVIQAYW